MADKFTRSFFSAIDKAIDQSRLIKECRVPGHQWVDTKPVELDDLTLDVKCSHCGTLANRAYQNAKGDA